MSTFVLTVLSIDEFAEEIKTISVLFHDIKLITPTGRETNTSP